MISLCTIAALMLSTPVVESASKLVSNSGTPKIPDYEVFISTVTVDFENDNMTPEQFEKLGKEYIESFNARMDKLGPGGNPFGYHLLSLVPVKDRLDRIRGRKLRGRSRPGMVIGSCHLCRQLEPFNENVAILANPLANQSTGSSQMTNKNQNDIINVKSVVDVQPSRAAVSSKVAEAQVDSANYKLAIVDHQDKLAQLRKKRKKIESDLLNARNAIEKTKKELNKLVVAPSKNTSAIRSKRASMKALQKKRDAFKQSVIQIKDDIEDLNIALTKSKKKAAEAANHLKDLAKSTIQKAASDDDKDITKAIDAAEKYAEKMNHASTTP